MDNKVLLVDGNSILHRGFCGSAPLINSKGIYVNGVFGFINIMSRYMRMVKPTHMAIAFDLPEETFRHEMYEEYKGTRPEAPDGFKDSFEPTFKMLDTMGTKRISVSGYEGDDVLGTLSRKFMDKADVIILSGDKDTLQLITDNVKVYLPKNGRITEMYDEEKFEGEYGIKPEQFIDVKALMGDIGDNIPGVKGIGIKTAQKLIKEFGSIENLYEHLDEVTPKRLQTLLTGSYDIAKFSKDLATIHTDIPVEISLSEMTTHPIRTDEVLELAKELEISSYIII